jgi:3-oxoacyl-[acyl-carrier-protein] synthase II
MSANEVVITGVGCISALGTSPEELSAALREGRSGIGEISSFDPSAYPCRHGAEVLDLELSDFIESSKTYLDRTSAFVLAACASALRDAHWVGDEGVGLILGTAWGCMDSLELFAQKLVEGKPKFVPPLPFTHSYANAPNSLAAIEFKLRGFNACMTCGHISGLAAVEYACRRVALGKEKRLLAGGSEALSEPVFHAYSLRGFLNPGDEPRPYDPQSKGMVLGEGSAVLAIEDADYAREWRDPVLARVAGWASCRGESVADGLTRSMEGALSHGGVKPDEVDIILGAACGLPPTDAAEVEAIRAVFGAARPAATSVKAWLGESLGAGGPMSLAVALACLEDHFIPVAVADSPPLLDGIRLIAGDPPHLVPRTLLVNAADPSGACVSVIVGTP